MTELESNKQLAAQFLTLSGNGSIDQAMALLTADVQFTTIGNTPVSKTRGFKALERLYRSLLVSIPGGIKFEFLEFTAEENRVAVEAQGHATTFAGKPYNNQYHFLFYFSQGRICRVREYLDTQLLASAFTPAQ